VGVAARGLLLSLLLPACATTQTAEQRRTERLAQDCLVQRDRDTLTSVDVDRFGRIWVRGRRTPQWTAEEEAFFDCLEGKGFRFRDRTRVPKVR
jgi:hypothetical protein